MPLRREMNDAIVSVPLRSSTARMSAKYWCPASSGPTASELVPSLRGQVFHLRDGFVQRLPRGQEIPEP
jgi:hypothetical protein